jgi:hypothetical protein
LVSTWLNVRDHIRDHLPFEEMTQEHSCRSSII